MTPSDLRAALEARREDITSLLRDLIRIPSTVGNESPAMGLLHDRLQGLADVVEYIPVNDSIRSDPDFSDPVKGLTYGGRPNLRVVKRAAVPPLPQGLSEAETEGEGRGEGAVAVLPPPPEGLSAAQTEGERSQGGEAAVGRSLLLNTHLDVVPPSVTMEHAFDADLRDGIVYGRGACDAKGQVAAAYGLLAVLNDLGLTPAADIIMHFVIEEEVGGNGTLAMVRHGDMAEACIVLEPTECVILPQIRGAVWFETTVYGQSGHSGRPGGTISALLKSIEAIEALTAYHASNLAQSRGKYPLFDQFENPAPLTIGQLSAGDWPAQAPQKCVFKGVLGILPDRTKEQVMEEMRAALQSSGDDWLAAHFHMDFTYRHDSSVIEPDHPVVQTLQAACAAAERETRVAAMTASCDAWLYTNQLGIPTVVFGPGSLGVAHSDQEQIAVDDVLKGVEILAQFVQAWCGVTSA